MGTNRRTLCLAAAVVGMAGLLIACSSPAPSPTATSAAKPAPTVAPASPTTAATRTVSPAAPNPTVAPAAQPVVPTGVLRIGLSSFIGGSIEPSTMAQPAAQFLGSAIYDSVLGVAKEGGPGPGLAERWEMAADGKTWSFYIRKGVKFHDGSSLTGADVKFSLDRIVAQGTAATGVSSTYAATLRTLIAGIDLKDDYTVVVRLSKADPEFWQYVYPGAGEGMVVPKKYIEERGVDYFKQNPIGTGPWKVVKYEFNTKLELEAVQGHWRDTPAFKTAIINAVPEEGTRLAMFKTGELDVAFIAWDSLAAAKTVRGARVVSFPSQEIGMYGLFPDLSNPAANPVGDVKVREAMSLAINRKEIAESIFGGYARAAAVPSFAASSIYFDSNAFKPYEYDAAKAKQLLTQAGYGDGFDFKLYSSPLAPWVPTVNEAIVGYWKKIGIRAQLVPMDWAALRPKIGPPPAPELIGNGGAIRSSVFPSFSLRSCCHSTAFWRTHNNKEVDALIEKTEATLDFAERKKVGVQATLAAKDLYSLVYTVEVDAMVVTGEKVGEWKPPLTFVPGIEYARIPRPK